MLKIGTLICRCGKNYMSRHTSYHIKCGQIGFLRHRSDDAKDMKSIIVEKEKKTFVRERKPVPWDIIPQKIEQFTEQFSEAFRHPTKQKERGRQYKDDEILFYFREKPDVDQWYVHTDRAIGGRSWGEFVQGENGMTAAFRGFTSQRIPRHLLPSGHDRLEEKHNFSGYACLQTKPFLSFFNREDMIRIVGFNVFEIRLRGDGRKYLFEALCDYDHAKIMYTIPVHTQGGPLWQTVRIPYSKMIASHGSTYTFIQESLSANFIKNFRFLLMDGIQGPFQLEIDYIALCKDLTESVGRSDYWDPYSDMNSALGTW